MSALAIEIAAPTLITEGTRVQGNLIFLSATQIHALVEGDILQESLEKLTVGRAGWVQGAVRSAGPIEIQGRVDGDIHSAVSIRLCATARVNGTLNAPRVEMRPGALFEGEFRMKAKAAKQNPGKKAA